MRWISSGQKKRYNECMGKCEDEYMAMIQGEPEFQAAEDKETLEGISADADKMVQQASIGVAVLIVIVLIILILRR